MRWSLWFRRRPNGGVEQARRAREDSEAQRPAVERIVYDLTARRDANNFAPKLRQALRGH